MTHTIRRLTEADAALYREIRLEALRLHPEAFGASFQNESAEGVPFFAGRLADNAVFGGFVADTLMGTAGFRAGAGAKQAHKGLFWGMYVRAVARGSGLSRALVEAVVHHARAHAVQVHLVVVSENAAARRLYTSMGFAEYGVEPRSLMVEGRYLDEVLMVQRLD